LRCSPDLGTQAQGNKLVAKANAQQPFLLFQQTAHATAQFHNPGLIGKRIGLATGQQHGVVVVKAGRVFHRRGVEHVKLPVDCPCFTEQTLKHGAVTRIGGGDFWCQIVVFKDAKFHRKVFSPDFGNCVTLVSRFMRIDCAHLRFAPRQKHHTQSCTGPWQRGRPFSNFKAPRSLLSRPSGYFSLIFSARSPCQRRVPLYFDCISNDS
jgi:hypothetical protein